MPTPTWSPRRFLATVLLIPLIALVVGVLGTVLYLAIELYF